MTTTELQERLQREIAAHNVLLEEEQKLELLLKEKRELRTQAIGRVHMAHEMLSEQLERESVSATENGSGDPERIAQPQAVEGEDATL